MILPIVFLFLVFSLGIIIIGQYSQNMIAYITGGLFLFVIGIVVLNAGVETASATLTNTTYSYLPSNFTNYTSETTVTQYVGYNDSYARTFGIFLSLGGAFCLVHGLLSVRNAFKRGADE